MGANRATAEQTPHRPAPTDGTDIGAGSGVGSSTTNRPSFTSIPPAPGVYRYMEAAELVSPEPDDAAEPKRHELEANIAIERAGRRVFEHYSLSSPSDPQVLTSKFVYEWTPTGKHEVRVRYGDDAWCEHESPRLVIPIPATESSAWVSPATTCGGGRSETHHRVTGLATLELGGRQRRCLLVESSWKQRLREDSPTWIESSRLSWFSPDLGLSIKHVERQSWGEDDAYTQVTRTLTHLPPEARKR